MSVYLRARQHAAARWFASRWLLVALCTISAVGEAAALAILGVQSGLAIAPQVSSPAPLGLFHDLRWLIVYQNSWWSFALESAGVLVLRSAFTAVTVRAAWPDSEDRPPWPGLLTRSIGFTFLAGILLAPWTILLFGLAVVSVSWLFFAAVPSVVVLSVLLSHGAISGDWWRRAPVPRALGWLLLSFVAASAASGIISLSPNVLAIPVAAAMGLFNSWAWYRMVQLVAERSPSRRLRPVAPVGIVAFLVLVVAGTSIGFASVANPARPSRNVSAADRSGAPVLVASGFWSSWNGRGVPSIPGDYYVKRFSYRGLGVGGRPLPYGSAETEKPLAQLDSLMSEQVGALHRETGRTVGIVAESEGALVAKTYLETTPGAPVDVVVLVSPLVTPGRVYYPPSGEGGWGVAAGLGLRGLSDTVSTMTKVDLAPDKPFLRSIVENAPALRTVLGCPVRRVRQYLVLPLADAVASPTTGSLDLPRTVLPAFHGGMLGDRAAQATIAAVLAGTTPPSESGWSAVERVIRPTAAAWEVPDLSETLNPAWASGGAVAAASGACGQDRALLTAALS